MAAVKVAGQRVVARLLARSEISRWTLWLAVFAPLTVVYLLTVRINPADMSADPAAVTPSAWQIAHFGTPRLPSSVQPFSYHNDWLIPSGSGQVVSNREPGLVLLAVPFYWVMSSAGVGNVLPAGIAAALCSSAAMATLALVARRLVPAKTAVAVGLLAGVATTTWSVSGTSLWPHGPDQLYLAVSMEALALGASGYAGLAFAAAILTRPPLAIVAAVTGVWQSWTRRSWRPALEIGAISAVALAGLLRYSHTYWQGGLDSQYAAAGGGFIRPFLDVGPTALGKFALNIVGTLIAPSRGILWGAPFLIVLVPGLRSAWRSAPQWARAAAVGGLLYLLVQLKGNRFSGGDRFWSYRYPLETLTLMAPLLVIAWRDWTSRTPRRRAAFFALAAIAIGLQAIGAVCFRGPYAGHPWLPYDLIAALIGHRGLLACVLLAGGFVSAGLVYRRVQNLRGEASEAVRRSHLS